MGKDRTKFSWISDKGEEREKEHTIQPHFFPFRSEFRKYTIIDCPGNKKYINNLINGLSAANAAVLIVDASAGQFEKGSVSTAMNPGGTIDHPILAKTFGV